MIPTRFGWLFFAGLLVMMFIGATYTNNLVYMLAFVLFSLGMITMLQTHSNLKYISIHQLNSQSGFEGGFADLTFTAVNSSNLACHSLEFEIIREVDRSSCIVPYVPENGRKLAFIRLPLRKRGISWVRGLRVSTVFPLGLFRAWFWIPVELELITFPKPEGDAPLPAASEAGSDNRVGTRHTGEDFSGHKKHAPGESLRHLDWKAFARGRGELTKLFRAGSGKMTTLSVANAPGVDLEARLRQVSHWLLQAKSQRMACSLEVGEKRLEVSDTPQHYLQCLRELALHEEASS